MDEKDTRMVEEVSHKEIQPAPPADYSAPKAKTEQMENARGWESENLIHDLEKELEQTGYKKGLFDLEFKDPKHFTYMLVIFASMGGLLSGLDQSLISGANLFLPKDLHLTDEQNSLVNSGMPLGGKCLLRHINSPLLTHLSHCRCVPHLALQRILRSPLGHHHLLHSVHDRWRSRSWCYKLRHDCRSPCHPWCWCRS
jgi:hypothetical protein